MIKNKKSFLLHIDSLDVLDDLTNGQAGVLFKAIKAYQKSEVFDLDSVVKVAFSPFKNQFERDNEKYEKLCEKNRLIAEKRHSTKSTTGTSGNQALPKCTKSTDNDSDNDSDSDSDSDNNKTLDQSKIDREKLETDSFNHWWKSYPKKTAKQSALKAWQKTIKKMDDEKVIDLTNHIVEDVKIKLDDLATGSDKFIGFDRLHATTYLNQERYNDE